MYTYEDLYANLSAVLPQTALSDFWNFAWARLSAFHCTLTRLFSHSSHPRPLHQISEILFERGSVQLSAVGPGSYACRLIPERFIKLLSFV